MALCIHIVLENVLLIKEQTSPYFDLDQAMAKFGIRTILTGLNGSIVVGLFIVQLFFLVLRL